MRLTLHSGKHRSRSVETIREEKKNLSVMDMRSITRYSYEAPDPTHGFKKNYLFTTTMYVISEKKLKMNL